MFRNVKYDQNLHHIEKRQDKHQNVDKAFLWAVGLGLIWGFFFKFFCIFQNPQVAGHEVKNSPKER